MGMLLFKNECHKCKKSFENEERAAVVFGGLVKIEEFIKLVEDNELIDKPISISTKPKVFCMVCAGIKP